MPVKNKYVSKSTIEKGRLALVVINESAKSGINIHSLASRLFTNVTSLQLAFQILTGDTISSYVDKKRLEISKTLLINTDHTMAWIADEIGFNDAAAFVRFFTRMEGITPGRWRNLHTPSPDQIF